MRRKNRKLNEGFSTAALTGRWMLLAVIGVSASLLYVWQHVQLVRTGYTIRGMERELEKWQKANEALRLVNERLKNPQRVERALAQNRLGPVSYTHLRAHETPEHLVCRLLLEKKKTTQQHRTTC